MFTLCSVLWISVNSLPSAELEARDAISGEANGRKGTEMGDPHNLTTKQQAIRAFVSATHYRPGDLRPSLDVYLNSPAPMPAISTMISKYQLSRGHADARRI